MDLKGILPTFEQFSGLVNTSNFLKEEIDLQSKSARKVGFKSWTDYLEYLYQYITQYLKLEDIVQELHLLINEKMELSGSIPDFIENVKNQKFEERVNKIHSKAETLPLKTKERILEFESRLFNLTFELLGKRLNTEIGLVETSINVFKDVRGQFAFTDKEIAERLQNFINYLESISFSNTNTFIKKISSKNYYFPDKAHLLKELHDELVSLNYITSNDDFEKSFKVKTKPVEVKATYWQVEVTKLYYLLYQLNDEQEYFKGDSIDKIANQLFTFPSEKTPRAIRTNFNKAFKKFNDKDYLLKKMSDIDSLLLRVNS